MMKEIILLVGHGSRNDAGNMEVEQFAVRWRKKHPKWRIELCFIEFASPSLDEGLRKAGADAEKVIVVPLILNAAGHVKTEIPDHIKKAENNGATYLLAQHIGSSAQIKKIMLRRLAQSDDASDPAGTGIILLGRGSSDTEANGEVAKLLRWIYEFSDYEEADLAFTGITPPKLERVIDRQARLGMRKIVILPYYLFTGILMERIRGQVKTAEKKYPSITFALADYIGFEEEIYDILDRRVAEAGHKRHHHEEATYNEQ